MPLEWFPRLRDATPVQVASYRLVGSGIGIHWPELDEDLSVRALLLPDLAVRRMRRARGSNRSARVPPTASR